MNPPPRDRELDKGMKTYKIECDGETHRVGLDDEGYLHALDHDEELERTMVGLGEEPSECLSLIMDLEENIEDGRIKDITLYEQYFYTDNKEVLKLLLDVADVDFPFIRSTLNGDIFLAAEQGLCNFLKAVFELGIANLDKEDKSLLLYKTISSGKINCVEIALELGADPNDVGSTGEMSRIGWTPLSLAIHYYDKNDKNDMDDIIKLLLENGANIELSIKAANKTDKYFQNSISDEIKDWMVEYGDKHGIS